MECAGAGQGRSEMEWKAVHDEGATPPAVRVVAVPGPVIVGAGPSGLAAAACLQQRNVPSVVVEREGCLASLWQLKAYDRLRLHLPKQFCELPLMPFPPDLPAYPTKEQFVAYLERYAARFGIRPAFGSRVERAEYEEAAGRWRVRCVDPAGAATEYLCRWLVAATGENAEAVVPAIEGMGSFAGRVLHTCEYRSGGEFRGKRVLVVGCGNSGMEVCLDLCNHAARPAIVVRDSVHVLPREMLGASTFGLSMRLLKWLPVAAVDRILLLLARLALGDTSRLGLHRPAVGPLRLKNVAGKTPVLDVGTLARIKTGHIQVFQGIKQLQKHSAEFVDGRRESFDAIILATGYKSNVPEWLKEEDMFSMEDGFPRKPFPDGWKGRRGLYAAGFTKRGLLGASVDARRIADDIARSYTTEGARSPPPPPP